MTVLRVFDASFARDGVELVEPFSLELRAGEEIVIAQPDARAASIAARLCAAIVHPTRGTIYVGEYETRLQPPQAKRTVGFVDRAGFDGDDHALRCEAAFRAEVWNLDVTVAQRRVTAVRDAFGDAPYARALALALVADVTLVVLDQPAAGIAQALRALEPGVALAITSVHVPA